jgi:predicted metallo-beta-lactamase superfamily hydrolase
MHVTKNMGKIHVRNLEQDVQNVPTELILNFDAVRSQEWSDRKKWEVIIPHQASPRGLNIASLGKKSASAA